MKELRVFEGSMMYLVLGILFIAVSLGLSYLSTSLEIQLIITQYLIIGLPPILYLLIKKKPLKKILRLNSLSIKTLALIIGLTLLVYPIAVLMNTLVMFILSLLGTINIPQIPTATNTEQFFLYLFIIALSAGICEEILFRGFIMRSFEKVGYKFAIIFSGILFGVFHFNIYNLGATIFFGILFGYLVVLTDSLWAGIIGHITNNALAVTLGFLVSRVQGLSEEFLMEGAELGSAEAIGTIEIALAIALFGFISLGTGFAAVLILKYLKKDNQKQDPFNSNKDAENPAISLKEFWPILPILIIFMALTGLQLYEILTASGF